MFLPRPYLISPIQDDSFNSAEQFLHPASSLAAKTLNSTFAVPQEHPPLLFPHPPLPHHSNLKFHNLSQSNGL